MCLCSKLCFKVWGFNKNNENILKFKNSLIIIIALPPSPLRLMQGYGDAGAYPYDFPDTHLKDNPSRIFLDGMRNLECLKTRNVLQLP